MQNNKSKKVIKKAEPIFWVCFNNLFCDLFNKFILFEPFPFNKMTKNIVIVGGGFAGTGVANALEKALAKSNDQEHRIILVEKVCYIACFYFIYNT